jgi:tetratricopeptide (TPR) repeat protein
MLPALMRRRSPLLKGGSWVCISFFLLALARHCAAAELTAAQQQLLSGDYAGCIATATSILKESPDDEDWTFLLCQALQSVGEYPRALEVMTNALAKEPRSLALRWLARDVLLSNGQTAAAGKVVQDILRQVAARTWAYREAPSLVNYGQALLASGMDPKRVLDELFSNARKLEPNLREVYLAEGDLALDKSDFALAAKRFQEGLKRIPDDPDLHFGLARAYAPSDSALMAGEIEAALARNSNHVGCLLLLVDHTIDAEDYAGADELLDRIRAINPHEPQAWAYAAVLAHLRNQPEAEQAARAHALKFWTNNPAVDHEIGRKLSQDYRFTEGATHQRQALAFDRDFLPAKAQLAQDLLRLGEETEGWKLIEEVQRRDGYDVEAYNLSTLHQSIEKFATLIYRGFIVRMSTNEAAIYGQRVVELLDRAKTNLCAKYGFEIKTPVTVEIFPQQKDFAVRTFGMPGNPGYLGVCFGSVITANSPATHPGHAVNWESVLWHEFCHVVTLQMTRNKMPRWLSEGISVYEENQADASWGHHIDPHYREMLLGDDLTPVSKLSAAFISPPSELHLQFAYLESSLVVEFIVQRFGLEHLSAILKDLGKGLEINKSIQDHTVPMEAFERDFVEFAHNKAEQVGPGLGWEKPVLETSAATTPGRGRRRGSSAPRRVPLDDAAWAVWAKDRPANFYVLQRNAEQAAEEKNWPDARAASEKLLSLYPDFTGEDSVYRILAAACRNLGDTNTERKVLSRFVELDNEAPDACMRLMELGEAAGDWPSVMLNADRYIAVNPLVAPPYKFMAKAAAAAGDTTREISAWRALLELDLSDPARVHFRLAQLLAKTQPAEARRHVLQSLEEAPRYPAALQLLLDIGNTNAQAKATQLTPPTNP